MTRILVVADEVDHRLWTGAVQMAPVDLLLSAGDLPFDYLEFLVDALDCPAVLVPGNHDPELDGFRWSAGLPLRDGFPAHWPGPRGWRNADTRVLDAAGVRVAGLGGSGRYRGGPNQWTQAQQARRCRRLLRKARARRVDVLLTHAPPRGTGDREDPPHQGFDCLHRVVDRLRPEVLLHGHIHPYGERIRDRWLGPTRVCNAVGSRIIDLTPTAEPSEL